MILKYLGCDKKYFRYELYNGERLELYVETKLTARQVVKNLFCNFGIKVASIGLVGYGDFWSYVQDEKFNRAPKGTAAERRRLYKIRHSNECASPGTVGFYACRILW